MKKNNQSVKRRYLIYLCVAIIITVCSFLLCATPKMKIRIIYALGQHSETVDYISFNTANEHDYESQIEGKISKSETAERRLFDEFFQTPAFTQTPESATFKLQARDEDEDNRIQIRALEIQNRNITMKKYSPLDLEKILNLSNGEDKAYVEGTRYCIEPAGEYVLLSAADTFLQDYKESQDVPGALFQNLLLMGLLLYVILLFVDKSICAWKNGKQGKDKKICMKMNQKDKFQVFMKCIMLAALVCCAIMALFSKFYAHPDEDVTRLAIDYYMSHWLPPNMNDVSVLGTFSNYGVTRLREPNLYYFFAGKVGWIFLTIFHISKYYRMLNIILFSIMVGAILLKRKDTFWMYVALGITPQLWYLYSYATSDAWDFFWGFWMIYELTVEDSLLNKLLNGVCRTPIKAVLWNSWIFGMLFLAKKNYYILLLFAFIVLVIKWFRTKENKMSILTKYVIITCCTLLLIVPRIVIVPYYLQNIAGRNMETEENVQESIATETALTVVDTRQTQGYSFLDVAIKDGKDIVSGLTNSGVGSYGWLEHHHSYWYGFGITGLYGILALGISYYMVRNRRWSGAVDTMVLMSMPVLAYLMVVYICWTADFQMQGRYALPLTLVVGYYGMQEKEVSEDRRIQGLICLLGVLSLCSYIGKGLYNLV